MTNRLPITILWKTDRLIAVQKPSGIFTHKNFEFPHEVSLMQLLRNQLNQYVYPVHRLDRGTSGVILFALSKESAKEMAFKFANREIDKGYLAIVRGHLNKAQEISSPILNKDTGKEQEASTYVEPLLQFKDRTSSIRGISLVFASPKTGRRHQIRRHLRRLNHPIAGDTTYGDSKFNMSIANFIKPKRLWLMSLKLGFNLPDTNESIEIISNQDKSFKAFLEKSGWRSIQEV